MILCTDTCCSLSEDIAVEDPISSVVSKPVCAIALRRGGDSIHDDDSCNNSGCDSREIPLCSLPSNCGDSGGDLSVSRKMKAQGIEAREVGWHILVMGCLSCV